MQESADGTRYGVLLYGEKLAEKETVVSDTDLSSLQDSGQGNSDIRQDQERDRDDTPI